MFLLSFLFRRLEALDLRNFGEDLKDAVKNFGQGRTLREGGLFVGSYENPFLF